MKGRIKITQFLRMVARLDGSIEAGSMGRCRTPKSDGRENSRRRVKTVRPS